MAGSSTLFMAATLIAGGLSVFSQGPSRNSLLEQPTSQQPDMIEPLQFLAPYSSFLLPKSEMPMFDPPNRLHSLSPVEANALGSPPTPVPEPATGTLVGLGAFLAYLSRRRCG